MLIRILDRGELVCKNKSNELLVNVGAPLTQSGDVWKTGARTEYLKKVLNNAFVAIIHSVANIIYPSRPMFCFQLWLLALNQSSNLKNCPEITVQR